MTPEEVFRQATQVHQAGRLDEAAALYDRLLAQFPGHPDTLHLRGLVALQRGDVAGSLSWFDRALAVLPAFSGAHVNRAAALLELGRYADAEAACDRALDLDPALASARANRAAARAGLGRAEAALADYDAALAANPGHIDALVARGRLRQTLGRRAAALADFEAALALDPKIAFLPGDALHLRMQLCLWDGLERRTADLLARVDADECAAQPLVLASLPSSGAQQRKAAAAFFASRALPAAAAPRVTRAPGEKLRIAYFSSDFHDHAVAHLMLGLLEAHDRSACEVLAFAFGGDAAGGMRRRIAAAVHRLVDVAETPDEEVVTLARGLGVHIAVDLNGYTGGARTGLFARRVAPVQVNFLGYPGTLGTPCHDYIIGDPVVTPPAAAADFSEQIVAMPHTYLVNSRIKRDLVTAPVTRADIGLPDRGIVFACFNGAFKITPDVFDVWMRLLNAVAGSVFWFSEDPASEAAGRLRTEARARGVPPERLVFSARSPGPDYLARFRLADIFMDTFHYNAHATAADALLVELPMVTRRGTTFASRVGASLLTAAGLSDLIAETTEDYERLALELARNPGRLAGIRARLADGAAAGPLFDAGRSARNLESAYREMWRRYDAGLAPGRIAVSES